MTFWNVGDEESKDQRLCAVGLDGFGLYHLAGSWCMSEIRDRRDQLPAEWFIPAWWVAGQDRARAANKLVKHGLWNRVEGGYTFAWIRDCNSPDAVRRLRKLERDRKTRQRHQPVKTPNGSGT